MRSGLLVAVAIVAAASRLALGHQAPTASACEPSVKNHAPVSRGIPETFYEQGRASLKAMLPQHRVLADKRSGTIGVVTYALLVYQPGPNQRVSLAALAVDRTRGAAWDVNATCGIDEWPNGLIALMEALAALPATVK